MQRERAIQETRLRQRITHKLLYWSRPEEPDVAAGVPHDLRFAPMLPEPGHLFAWMHQPISNAGIDETATRGHQRSKRQG